MLLHCVIIAAYVLNINCHVLCQDHYPLFTIRSLGLGCLQGRSKRQIQRWLCSAQRNRVTCTDYLGKARSVDISGYLKNNLLFGLILY